MNWAELLPQRYRVVTEPLRTERRVELIALIMIVLLLVGLIYGATRLVLMRAPDSLRPAADVLAVGEVKSWPPVSTDATQALLNQPLFWPSRRPLAPVEVIVTEPKQSSTGTRAAQIKGVILVGVFGGGDSAGIIVLYKGNKRRVMVGEELDGWKLKSVAPESAVISSGDRNQTLALQRLKGAPKATKRDKTAMGEVSSAGGEASKPRSSPEEPRAVGLRRY